MKKGNTPSFKVLFILTAIISFFIINAPNTFAEFYVIAGSRGVGTEIKSLPYTILSPGFYYITKDLTCATSTHGITITADNVTLDLMGFSLIGPGGSESCNGIYMDNRTNVEIRNGTVRNFPGMGIYEYSSSGTGHRVINIRAKDNGQHGIRLDGKNHIVEKCTVMGNGVRGGYNGIASVGYGSSLIDNRCYYNSDQGIYASPGSTVAGNTCYFNVHSGIYTGNGSTVTGNTCYDNGEHGIWGTLGSTVTGNTCYDNSNHGILAGEGSTVTGNTCCNNTNYGICLSGNNLVDQNTAMGNGIHKDRNSCTSCTISTTNHFPDPEPDP